MAKDNKPTEFRSLKDLRDALSANGSASDTHSSLQSSSESYPDGDHALPSLLEEEDNVALVTLIGDDIEDAGKIVKARPRRDFRARAKRAGALRSKGKKPRSR